MNRCFVLFVFLGVLFTNLVCFASDEYKPIKLGMKGDEVLKVQQFLAQAGFYLGELDGIFGNQTLRAVQELQKTYSLNTDGVVGKDTYACLKRSIAEPSRYGRTLNVTATAYSAYDDGNSSYTCRGNLVRKGIVAVDPSVIPLGTRMYIPGYGYARADDIGGLIKGNKIDLAFDSHAEAVNFGVKNIKIYLLD